MDPIGVDVHKRESQIYMFADGVRSSSNGFALNRSALTPRSSPGPAPGS